MLQKKPKRKTSIWSSGIKSLSPNGSNGLKFAISLVYFRQFSFAASAIEENKIIKYFSNENKVIKY